MNLSPYRHRAFPRSKESPRREPQILPLPIDRPSFEFLSERMRLPKSFLQFLERVVPVQKLMEAVDEDVDQHIGIGTSDSTVMADSMLMTKGYISLDCRSHYTQCSLAIRKIGFVTHVLLIGLDETLLETVFGCLEHVLGFIGCLFLVPLLIAEAKADYCRMNLDKCHRHINEFEPTAGYHIDDDKNTHHVMEPTVFDRNIRRLTSTTGRLAWCKRMADGYHDILEFIETAVKDDMQEIANPPPEMYVVLSKISDLKQFMKENKSRACYLQERREGYIQTVSRSYKSTAIVSGPVMADNL